MNQLCHQAAFEIYAVNNKEPQPERALANVSLIKIFDTVQVELGFKKGELRGRRQYRTICDARCIAMILIRDYKPKLSKTKIARIFNRDHSTFCYSEEKFEDLIQTNKAFREKYERVKSAIEGATA